MKRVLFFASVVFILSACVVRKNLDLSMITYGMNVDQVVDIAGNPNRVLVARQTVNGYQEVLEYRTRYSEVYALEFWNNYLTGFEHLYSEVPYVEPVRPPVVFPEYGRPIVIIHNHNNPGRPQYRPNDNRPHVQPNRPTQSARPTETNRPTQSTRTTKTKTSRSVSPANSSRSNYDNNNSQRRQ